MRIDDILVRQAAMFAMDNNYGYAIMCRPSNEDAKLRNLEIEMLDYEHEPAPHGRNIFTHLVVVDQKGRMVSQKTMHVAKKIFDRNAYLKFIELLKKSKINLTNDHAELWRSNPHDYPV